MGTNYYFQYHTDTGRAKDLHIGKNSYGWEFTFHGYRDSWNGIIKTPVSSICAITSFADWKNLFKEMEGNGQIFDEYDCLLSTKDFIKLVNKSRDKNGKALNHTIYCKEHHPEHAKNNLWLDEEGWSFDGLAHLIFDIEK